MKSTLISIIMSSLLAAFASAQPHYTVTDLGTLPGGTFSQATSISDGSLVTGLSTAADGTSHAVVWLGGHIVDVSQPGLGGPNSGAGGANLFGQIVLGGETAGNDPNNENFCGYFDGLICRPYVWRYGAIQPLPTLGGNNASWGGINNLGQVAGYAETSVHDAACPGVPAVNGTGPFVLDFEPVVWGPKPGTIRKLPVLLGDTVGLALSINDFGQAVGISGNCANTIVPGFAAGPHAVLWDSDGSIHDLGNLGGTANPALLAVGNAANFINDLGHVAGGSSLPGSTTFHPYFWTKEKGMRDLGVLSGDLVGAGLAINNRDDVVGPSISAPGPASGNPRAFLWKNGQMYDLNSLLPADAPMYLLTAFGINDSEEIVGFGVTNEGDIHAFLASPCEFCTHPIFDRPRVPCPEKARHFLHW